MAKQYGSASNTKLDYQKMTRYYSTELLKLQEHYNLLKAALKEEQKQNEQLRAEAKRLRQTITNQKNRIADKSQQHSYMGTLEYRGTK